MKTSILVSYSKNLYREGIINLLKNDARFNVIGECENFVSTMHLVTEKLPKVVLMEVNLNNPEFWYSIKYIGSRIPGCSIICVGTPGQYSYLKNFIKRGATGFLTPSCSAADLMQAIQEVSDGRDYLCKEIRNSYSKKGQSPQSFIKPDLQCLTRREMEIIAKIVDGYSSKEIAGTLLISFKTVEVHRHNILRKLGVKNTASLIKRINESSILC